MPPVPLAATQQALSAPPPPPAGGEVHVSVDAPFVFRAKQPAPPPMPPVTRLRLETMPAVLFSEPAAPPPAPKKPADKLQPVKRAFGHVRSFLGSLFR